MDNISIFIKDKNFFIRYFLQPISKISESCCLNVNDKGISCVINTPDNSIIANFNHALEENPIKSPSVLNVPDVNRLIKALDAINDEQLTLIIDKNNLQYKNSTISFKYHLLENGVLNRPKINVDKINSITIDTEFNLTDKALQDIIKASTFCVDSNKIYLFSKDKKLYGELTDRSRPNIDSFTVELAQEVKGASLSSLCLNLEVVRILSTNKIKQVHCKANNNLGVVLFEYGNNILKAQYIVSSLTK